MQKGHDMVGQEIYIEKATLLNGITPSITFL
jgi:hypothetical protein